MPELGVNIDHVATVREARKTIEPDPVWAAAQAEIGGADGITVHLREDRRHIQDRDLRLLKETVTARLNMELACSDEMLKIAVNTSPDQATLVPEKREEITTEGGLDVLANRESIGNAIKLLQQSGIFVSLFIDPSIDQVTSSAELGADAVELHTGSYALAKGDAQLDELDKLLVASQATIAAGLALHAGHGLTYHNVIPIASIPSMRELNIGHSIISRALLVGMEQAVAHMKQLIDR